MRTTTSLSATIWLEKKAKEANKMLDKIMKKTYNHANIDESHTEDYSLSGFKIVARDAPESYEKDDWTKIEGKRAELQKRINSTAIPTTKLEVNEMDCTNTKEKEKPMKQ